MCSKLLILLLFSAGFTSFTLAQKVDSIKHINLFSGSAGVTQNGISLIPTFSLNKPAAMFKMSLGKKKFSFDPEFNFSLGAKPWYFLFWFRYKLITNEKFRMNVGTHLGLNFRSTEIPMNSKPTKLTITDRYVVVEIAPNYSVTKHISIGIYYLNSHGLDVGTVGTTNFLTLNANFSNIKLTDKFFMKVTPQFYYLKMDENDGFYLTSVFTLVKRNFPLSLSSVMNKVIRTNIAASKDFVWNITLTYSFNGQYVAM